MLYAIEEVEDLQKLNEAVSLENQVRAVRLQGELGKKNYHHKYEICLNQLLI